ncbi:MAG: D-glycero-beta-D-manno-heptose 1-phosphate adenylyltransferase [Candidatus Omnitrophota bacterium]
MKASGRVIGQGSLSKILSPLRAKGKKIVFTNGCFDIIHTGHVKYLSRARRMGDLLVIGLNSDASVRRLKGRSRPINKQSDRAKVLAALRFVDYVVIFNEDTPERLIRKVRPDFLVKGGDWDESSIVGGRFVKSYGGKVGIVSFVNGYSTTSLVRRISGN